MNARNHENDQNIMAQPRSSRFAVHEALENANYIGSPFVGGKGDGAMAMSTLPFSPGLVIKRVGKITSPIGKDQVSALKDPTVSFKTNDDVFTNIYQIESRDIKVKNPAWDKSLGEFLIPLASKLGLKPCHVSAELDCLLFGEKGSSIDWCCNVDNQKKVVGTLLIQIPSAFTGGTIRVHDGDEGGEENTVSFDMGESTGESEYECHYLAHFNDCHYKMDRIKTGQRILLKYSIRYNGKGTVPSAAVLRRSVIPLGHSLELLPRADRIFLVPLAQLYTSTSLAQKGINALEPDHRATFEALNMSSKSFNVLLVQATKVYSIGVSRYEEDEDTWAKNSIEGMYNEEGQEIQPETSSWLQEIMSFAPVAEAQASRPYHWNDDESYSGSDADDEERDHGVHHDFRWERHVDVDSQNHSKQHLDAMLLTSSQMVQDNWGRPKCRKIVSDEYGPHRYTYATTYKSTFLLAYDQDSELELKCLPGIDKIAHVITEEIIELLARLLDVVESKEHCELDSVLFRDLLHMILNCSAKTVDLAISFVNRILLCSPSKEPDAKLWNVIVIVVEKFGWDNIRDSVTCLLYDAERKINSDSQPMIVNEPTEPQSRINLPVFLLRVEFALKLKKIGNKNIIEFVDQFVSDCIIDLENTNNKYLCGSKSTEIIERIVAEHGFIEHIVVNSLVFYLANARDDSWDIFYIGDVIYDLHSTHGGSRLEDCLIDFAPKFAPKVSSYWLQSRVEMEPAKLMKCILAVIQHGSQHDKDELGKRIISSKKAYAAILKLVTDNFKIEVGVDSKAFLRDMMNQCLIQHSDRVTRGPPSSHIQMAFEACPTLATSVDDEGRLPLHWVAARSDEVPHDTLDFILEKNPSASNTRDPVSKMYPFMIAASVGNAAAAFQLLVASPTLVASAIVAGARKNAAAAVDWSKGEEEEDDDDDIWEEYSYLAGEIVVPDQDYISVLTGDDCSYYMVEPCVATPTAKREGKECGEDDASSASAVVLQQGVNAAAAAVTEERNNDIDESCKKRKRSLS